MKFICCSAGMFSNPDAICQPPRSYPVAFPIGRRAFLRAASGLAAATLIPRAWSQQRLLAGVVPVGKTTVANGRTEVLQYCDEIQRLGFHRYEVNNTRAGIAEYYSERTAEFKEQMDSRHLTLVGLAQFSRAGRSGSVQELLDQHLLIGRFLADVGGKYVSHMLALGEILNETDEAGYRDLDVKIWAKNANEVGRRLFEQCGIKLGYHPLRAEVSGGLYRQFLELTDEYSVSLIADIGHLAAGGADPVEVCRAYRRRLIAVHLKDFSPAPSQDKGTKTGNVPFGQGTVNLLGVVAELRRSRFSGWVLGESGGTNLAMRDYMTHTLHMAL